MNQPENLAIQSKYKPDEEQESAIKVSDVESASNIIDSAEAAESAQNGHKMLELDHIEYTENVSERYKKRRRSQMLVIDSEAS